MQTTELLWVEQLAKVKSLEQRTEVSTGSASQTQERNSFLTFPSPMQTAERPSVIRAQSSERRTEETLGFLNQAERQKRCTEFRLPTQIMERSVASNSEVRVLSSELQTAETTGLSRHHTHCLKARVHSMQSPLPMQTPEPLLAKRGLFSERRMGEITGFNRQAEQPIICMEFTLPMKIMERSLAFSMAQFSERRMGETTGFNRQAEQLMACLESTLPMLIMERSLATPV